MPNVQEFIEDCIGVLAIAACIICWPFIFAAIFGG